MYSYVCYNNHMELLTPEEAAAILKLSAFTVRKLLRNGTLPGIKIGGGKEWRIYRSDLESYLASQRTKGG